MYFYEILQEIMDEKSLSIPDVARLSGLTDSTIRSIINRKNKTVALEVAFKLSKGLNVSLERLNGEDNNIPKATNNTIGNRIEYLIHQQNMSKKDFAESIKTHITQLSKIINGDCQISEVLLCLICQKYNVNKDWLINGIGEMENITEASQSAKILAELYEVAKDLSEDEQLYLLDTVKALKQRLNQKRK